MSWITDCAVWEGIILEPAPEPPLLPDLLAWWDFSDTATITATGSDIDQVDDKSGNARHLVSGAGNVATGTRTQNGLNVADFPGNAELDVTGGAFMYDNGAVSIFIVFKIDTDPTGVSLDTFRFLISESRQTISSTPLYWPMRYTTTNLEAVQRTDGNVTKYTIAAGDPGLVNPHLATFTDSGTAVSLQIDNNTAGTASYTRAATTLTNCRIGSMHSPTGNIRFHDGMMGEIIIYDHALSGGDITLVKAYLNTKWGL